MKKHFNFLATAIGSLPHKNSNEAIDLIFNTISNAPLCPQLSKINFLEDMIFQYTENFPGIKVDENLKTCYADLNSDEYFTKLEEMFIDYEELLSKDVLDDNILSKYAISEKYASAFPYFLEQLKLQQPKYVKGQIIGAFTFGTSTVDTENKCVFYDETFREVIAKMLTIKALWQVCEFKKASPNSTPIIFMDEPTISQMGTSAYVTVSPDEVKDIVNQIADALHKFGIIVGMHCCGKADWQMVLGTNIDLINFDTYSFSQNFSLYSKDIDKFLNKDGIIAWGIVPTLDENSLKDLTSDKLVQIFENAKNLLISKGIDEEKIIRNSIITPSCGAGSLNLENATKVMNLLKEVSADLKNKYCGVQI